MNYYQENKKRSQLTPKTKILLKFYNEISGEQLKNWEDIPLDKSTLLLELGFESIAKVYAKRLIEKGVPFSEISIKTGLSIMKVQGLG